MTKVVAYFLDTVYIITEMTRSSVDGELQFNEKKRVMRGACL